MRLDAGYECVAEGEEVLSVSGTIRDEFGSEPLIALSQPREDVLMCPRVFHEGQQPEQRDHDKAEVEEAEGRSEIRQARDLRRGHVLE